ncbi:hypothetical protein BV898_03268 [Hypsibius exemplaris]|uniref:MARVEL domain-containing protein n=1 Tax=Hypsibius exemplaris TaxID=2072580 RepID=A0A1W0X5R5_HYPEX|nr:hypothetical protein BV898_03268 [Hypsibius exemplaris]
MAKMPEPYSSDQYPTQQYPPQQQPYGYGQQPSNQQQYPGGQTYTTVVVQREGCCGIRGRVQWVIGYNIVFGILNLIAGIGFITLMGYTYSAFSGYYIVTVNLDHMFETLAGLAFTIGILMVSAGFTLAFALSKKNPNLFNAWFVLFGLFAILNIGWIGYVGYAYNSYYSGGYVGSLLGSCVVNLLIQVACIFTVIKYKQSPLY